MGLRSLLALSAELACRGRYGIGNAASSAVTQPGRGRRFPRVFG